MRKNIFDFIRDIKHDNNTDIVNDENENYDDVDGDVCSDCRCNITKTSSPKPLEKNK